jgi:Ca-activated chloride channel family protein
MIVDPRDATHSNSADRYGKFIDQPWKTPASDPLSTFSIDVDTASYGNVRRMILEGRSVPRDAVRIEECINAFAYHYQAPKGGAPFAVGASLAVCPWNPEHQLVRVAIKGREVDATKRPASNLVFLIDVSGSMQSRDKLPLLKQSMTTLVEQLDERDRVAIVVYAGSEGVVLPPTRLTAEGRSMVLQTLANLQAGGSTNGGAGIKRAYQLAMDGKLDGGVNRVILATDGDFNVGVTGNEELVSMVRERAKSGVYLTVLGYGTGNLNDSMMDAITRDGNGNYFYIDSEREGRKVFLRNLTGTLVTIAKDVKIQVEFNPAKVGGYRLIGYANRVLRNEDFNNDKVDAGDIGAGHTVTAFYEITPNSVAGGTDALKYLPSAKPAEPSDEWLTVKLRHKHPDGDESRRIEFPLTGTAGPIAEADRDFQFAGAVALFGMKLRGMEEVAAIGWDKVRDLAKPGLAEDADEGRAEFMSLLDHLSGVREHAVPAPAEVIRGR